MANHSSPLTARPTVYNGIEMRSRLEAWWAQQIDSRGDTVWEYEPCAFASEDGQYLPDFRYYEDRPGGRRKAIYVELKGIVHDALPILKKMEIIWASDSDATLILVEGHGDRSWLGYRYLGEASWWSYGADGDLLGTVE